MLAKWGRKADAALARGTDTAHEAAHTTVLHVQRIAAALTSAVTRVGREAQDLAWDYRDVARDLRRRRDKTPDRSNVVELRPVHDPEPRRRES